MVKQNWFNMSCLLGYMLVLILGNGICKILLKIKLLLYALYKLATCVQYKMHFSIISFFL